MESFLIDQNKFRKTNVKDDNFLKFVTSHEKRINKIHKKLVDSNRKTGETQRHLKPVGSRPGIR